MEPAFLFVVTAAMFVIVGGVVVIVSYFKGEKKNDQSPYSKRTNFFDSKQEFELYAAVAEVCGDNYLVFPHVHLGRVLEVKQRIDWKEKSNYRSRIDRKSADLAICNRTTGEVEALVELGGDTHNFPDKKSRDKFVDDLAHVTEFPLIDLKLGMSKEAVREELQKFLTL